MFLKVFWEFLKADAAAVCVSSGFQEAAVVHRRSGSPEVEHRGLLEDGLGAKRLRHRHDHQPGGERKSE